VTTDIKTDKKCKICDRVHPNCIVCGAANAKGLQLQFEATDDESARAVFKCDRTYEGYTGILHGGIISSILDGAMGNCMFRRGLTAVTVEMILKFKYPVKTEKEATVTARITRIAHPLYLLEAEIIQDDKIKATARAKFYDRPELADELARINEL
jgi:uncharacterized protein (TIGR00369 family)